MDSVASSTFKLGSHLKNQRRRWSTSLPNSVAWHRVFGPSPVLVVRARERRPRGGSPQASRESGDNQSFPDSLVFQTDESSPRAGPELVERAEATIADARAALEESRSRWAQQEFSMTEQKSAPQPSLQVEEENNAPRRQVDGGARQRTAPAARPSAPKGQTSTSPSIDTVAEMPQWASSMMSGGPGVDLDTAPRLKPSLQPFMGDGACELSLSARHLILAFIELSEGHVPMHVNGDC